MVMVIKHIDAIAREKRRDVLYLEFHPVGTDGPYGTPKALRYCHEKDSTRQRILQGLDERNIPWMMCGEYANVRQIASYRGQVYLDVPFDESDDMYCTLRDYLEHPDGSIKHDGVRFYVLSYEFAMKNAAHDEPGFWEKWAEDF